ncbi:PREDICTED: probable E3 SUMO-protein ligase RNF212 [Nicrophorus vespilloides]|uniref:Probable E3 SUMO-protein ligase RNF212 n=1 Tax=Nicrophorus vespilloides TaxID=110193 RepID=A0ABM1MFU8_NICVS|nr:PREDICTED: probable E3 SUMO-protein ligase RNF212 [Nicrophorus vespilloides]
MQSANWIHCNKCYARYSENLKFYITNCGHLNCESCTNKFVNNGSKCLICQQSARTILLSDDMNNDVQTYFTPINEQFGKLSNVVSFQMKNHNSLLKNMLTKYNFAKNEIMKSYKTINDLKKEILRLRMLLKNRTSDVGSAMSVQLNHNIMSPQSVNSTLNASSNYGPMMDHHMGPKNLAHMKLSRAASNQQINRKPVPVHSNINNNNIGGGRHMGEMMPMAQLNLGFPSKYNTQNPYNMYKR